MSLSLFGAKTVYLDRNRLQKAVTALEALTRAATSSAAKPSPPPPIDLTTDGLTKIIEDNFSFPKDKDDKYILTASNTTDGAIFVKSLFGEASSYEKLAVQPAITLFNDNILNFVFENKNLDDNALMQKFFTVNFGRIFDNGVIKTIPLINKLSISEDLKESHYFRCVYRYIYLLSISNAFGAYSDFKKLLQTFLSRLLVALRKFNYDKKTVGKINEIIDSITSTELKAKAFELPAAAGAAAAGADRLRCS